MKKILFLFILICTVFSENSFAQSKRKTTKKFQRTMNKQFKNAEESPLPEEEINSFKGLPFFKHNKDLVVKAKFKKLKNEKVFEMPTTTDRKPQYRKYAKLTFNIDGKKYKLFAYQNIGLIKEEGYEDYLFLPFTDLTNGNATYGGGRFLDLRIPESNEVEINFNKAYNPYCAYNYKYSCPIPPKENHLNIKIEAGVKAPKNH